jgi:hypothetical protein
VPQIISATLPRTTMFGLQYAIVLFIFAFSISAFTSRSRKSH